MTCHFPTFDLGLEESATSVELSMTVCDGGYEFGCTDGAVITAMDAVNIVKGCS